MDSIDREWRKLTGSHVLDARPQDRPSARYDAKESDGNKLLAQGSERSTLRFNPY